MLEVEGLVKRFGALLVTDHVTLRLEKSERHVLLGPNGAGKTTLFNLVAGTLKPDAGAIRINGADATHLPPDRRARLGLARSYQKNNVFDELTVEDNLGLAAAAAARRNHVFWRDTLREPEITATVREVAGQVGLSDQLDIPAAALSYGGRRQLEVGLAMATRPRILMLDEPTSGVSPNMTQAFHRLVAGLPRSLTMLIIEHDMDLAFAIADRLTVLNYGKVVFEGTPEAARASPLVREIYLGGWHEDA